ncbi:hypothetical protein BOTBODRAFT_175835 [Botryobasidium botryosum FD-172 SS1]|uniref:Uncharacterized protein n=1 Tax=Botryobasidium botryosum (strain FD-172 SS1) TaxID=930990 RepID=A0A067MMY2_BOTB1|nr:hypothetical protein BOTBODRAFT_175835 [Botryobasidium botryosum FD-172 SS1]
MLVKLFKHLSEAHVLLIAPTTLSTALDVAADERAKHYRIVVRDGLEMVRALLRLLQTATATEAVVFCGDRKILPWLAEQSYTQDFTACAVASQEEDHILGLRSDNSCVWITKNPITQDDDV